ncbi:MAG: serine/threonine protein kinase [Gemmatimonadaceae bacterium]|nr:serine/threonine protein kinase [Gemmatimonadaceae bacterium]
MHRDIKPENVLLSGDGKALLADYGIAHAVSAVERDGFTSTGVVIGTPLYMSPEQSGGGPIDGRSDIYSLGCLLYEMLAGDTPFHGATPQAILARHMLTNRPPCTLCALRSPVAGRPRDADARQG